MRKGYYPPVKTIKLYIKFTCGSLFVKSLVGWFRWEINDELSHKVAYAVHNPPFVLGEHHYTRYYQSSNVHSKSTT